MAVIRIFLLVTILLYGRGCGDGVDCEAEEGNSEQIVQCALREVDKEIGKEYDAIRKVHMHLDDDHDGNVDTQESAEFIKDELNADNGSRHKKFHHQNKDDHISVKDIWGDWYKSQVYNWTVDDVIHWLVNVVHLPEYSDNFRNLRIQGKDLPKIAINSEGIMQFDLGISDSSHKKKLGLRAMDVILFGPPKVPYHWWKDIILISLVSVCVLFIIGSWRERKINKVRVEQLKTLMKTAEDKLADLQQKMTEKDVEIEAAHEETPKRDESIDKPEMERSDSKPMEDLMSLPGSLDDTYTKHLQSQISQLHKEKLQLLEQMNRRGETMNKLQQLLMNTYWKEHSHWVSRKSSAEKQLSDARKQCEKIDKRKGTIFGSLRIINSPAFHDADLNINRALVSLKEVMDNLDEYKQRWRAIEDLTGLHVVSTSVKTQEQTVMLASGEYHTSISYEQASSFTGSSFDSVDNNNFETVSQISGYSVSSKSATLPAHRGSSQSLEQQQSKRQHDKSNMKKSSSDGKLHSSGNHFKSSLFRRVGVYKKIEEDNVSIEQDSVYQPHDKDSPNTKRKIYKESKGI